jgi:hypothetical protein
MGIIDDDQIAFTSALQGCADVRKSVLQISEIIGEKRNVILVVVVSRLLRTLLIADRLEEIFDGLRFHNPIRSSRNED